MLPLFLLLHCLKDYLYCLKFARILSRFLSKESCVVQYVKDRLQPWRLTFKVENIGVEPMTSCMPCKRPSQLS